MKHSDKSRANLIARRFRRWGESGKSTGLLSEMGNQYEHFLAANVNLEPNEQIVVIAIESEARWCVLTTRRLIGNCDSRKIEIKWRDITDVDAAQSSVDSVFSGAIMTSLSRLCVTDTNGEKVTVITEPGPPCFGFWNALRLAQQLGNSG